MLEIYKYPLGYRKLCSCQSRISEVSQLVSPQYREISDGCIPKSEDFRLCAELDENTHRLFPTLSDRGKSDEL
jgi:hypothetical protein